jgi:hypothetical protein
MRNSAPIAQVMAWLEACGWWEGDVGWRHKALHYHWPLNDAVRLTEEALDGRADLVYRMLREDA